MYLSDFDRSKLPENLQGEVDVIIARERLRATYRLYNDIRALALAGADIAECCRIKSKDTQDVLKEHFDVEPEAP